VPISHFDDQRWGELVTTPAIKQVLGILGRSAPNILFMPFSRTRNNFLREKVTPRKLAQIPCLSVFLTNLNKGTPASSENMVETHSVKSPSADRSHNHQERTETKPVAATKVKRGKADKR
jgi:hypothetical protein